MSYKADVLKAMNPFDLMIENAKKRLYYLYHYRDYARIIKKKVLSYFPDARVIVFGSVIDGNVTANSDIDILIVIDERDYAKEAEVRSEIIKDMFDVPFELHFASRDQFEKWYKRFIERYEEI